MTGRLSDEQNSPSLSLERERARTYVYNITLKIIGPAGEGAIPMENNSVIDIIDTSSDEDSVVSMEREENIVISIDDSDDSVVYIETSNKTNNTNTLKTHRFKPNNKKRRKKSSTSKENPLFSSSKARKIDAAGSSVRTDTSRSHYCCSSARIDRTKVDVGCHSDKRSSFNVSDINGCEEPLDNTNRGKWKDFFMFSKDAESEQERLFREAAERVRKAKQQTTTPNDFAKTTPLSHCFERPIEDVTKLPMLHWTWDNLYARLGLPEGASLQLVKRHYRKLALQYHPDKSDKRDITLANKRFHAIKDAYEQILRGGC